MAHSLDREIDRLREILWSARDPQGRAFASLADAYRRRGDLPLARTMITEGLERLPHFSSAHVVAGWIHRDQGSPVEADRSFRRVLELDPENAMALQGLGELAEERGSHAEAAEFFRRLSHVSPMSDDDGDADGHADGPGPGSDAEAQGRVGVHAASLGIEDLSPDVEDRDLAPDPARDEAPASRTGAVPVQSLFPDDNRAADPGTGEDDPSWADVVFAGDEPAKTVSVGDLVPDDDTFDFAVADLGDQAGPDAEHGGMEEAHDPVAGWGLLEEREHAVESPPDALSDAGAAAETAAETIDREAPGIDESGRESAPDWGWSSAVDQESGVDAPATASGADAEDRSHDQAEARPGGPSRDDAVPIASLAPDGESATPTVQEKEPSSAGLADEPAPEPGAPEAQAPSGDAGDAPNDDGSDDFQAWLERNSV